MQEELGIKYVKQIYSIMRELNQLKVLRRSITADLQVSTEG